MASKNLPSSSGYFNKKMLDILEKGEKKQTTTSKKTTSGGKSTKRK